MLPALLLAILALPAASAGLIPTHDFQGTAPHVDLFGAASTTESGKIPPLMLLLGQAEAEGSDDGLFFFLNSRNATMRNVARIEIYDSQGGVEAVNRTEFVKTGRPIHKVLTNATVTLSRNATFVLHNGELRYTIAEGFDLTAGGGRFNFSAETPFGFSIPVKPPPDLGTAVELVANNSLLLVGKDFDFSASMRQNKTESFAFLLLQANGRATITNATRSESFVGKRYVFVAYERADIAVDGAGAIVPFQANTTAAFRPGSSKATQAGFDLSLIDTIQKAYKGEENNATGKSLIPKQVTDNLKTITPLLNGALIQSTNGTIAYGNKEQELGNFTLIRYSTFSLTGGPNQTVAFDGRAKLMLLGSSFATTKGVVPFGPLDWPVLSLVLWVLALGAIAAGFLLKPFLSLPQVGLFGAVRLIGWIFHGLALFITFLLWDAEIKSFLGTSLITIFSQGAFGQGVAFAIVGAFEVVPLLLAFFYFAYPIRFLVNSGLKLAGLKRARGIGKGIGDVAAWLLGAPFIPVFLNLIVGALLKGITGAF